VEIHAPHKPILTVTEALVHLAIVTVGILIALSLEGARQWHEHRSLVSETRESLTREIQANRAELAGYVENATTMQKQLMHAREVAQAVADGARARGLGARTIYGTCLGRNRKTGGRCAERGISAGAQRRALSGQSDWTHRGGPVAAT
jgi:hypothetical protein